MKTNRELQIDVLEAIRWEPLFKQAEICVDAHDGIITLSGIVNSYIKKSQAEELAKKITGVRAVVEKIEVKFDNDDKKSDGEIAIEVLNELKLSRDVSFDNIQVQVEGGHVTLEGELEWNHQKQAAQQLVSNIDGIKVLTNNIKIEDGNADDIVRKDIERVLDRNWAMNNQDIQVYVTGNKVTLHGTVHSFYQKEEAGRMAWNTPGIYNVNNELLIDYAENLT